MIYQHIKGLIQKALDVELISSEDQIYVRNQVLAILQLEFFPNTLGHLTDDSIPNLLDKLVDYAVEHNIINNVFDEKEILSASIMNCFIPMPSELNNVFQKKYSISPQEATKYFYELSKNSNYIQMNRINRNIHFKAETIFGKMDITINLSKPEKDSEQIKKERDQTRDNDYPKCLLCIENEGYVGRTGYPARANHRVVKIPLGDENWYLQYSPYVYYNEHSILLAEKHCNMKIEKKTFERLLTFIEKFPHYFIGSNADLPIVGGSILSHNHYQAGNYDFPMKNASTMFSFVLKRYPEILASVVKWPLSTIRLQSEDKDLLIQAADYILTTWKGYNDENVDIRAFSGDTPHNTITPIARKHDQKFELDLVLRNNRVNEKHPLGIFHPHADVHHIKKENIGLIEVMGLAVLPARLKDEIAEIKKFLIDQKCNVVHYHVEWANQIKNKYREFSDHEKIDSILERELGNKFAKVLEDSGVFKERIVFERFINYLNT